MNSKSTIFTSRRIATLIIQALVLGAFTGAAVQYPGLLQYVDTALIVSAAIVATAFASFTITDIDWGQKAIELSQEIGIEVDDELLEALRPKLEAMITGITAKVIQDALGNRK